LRSDIVPRRNGTEVRAWRSLWRVTGSSNDMDRVGLSLKYRILVPARGGGVVGRWLDDLDDVAEVEDVVDLEPLGRFLATPLLGRHA